LTADLGLRENRIPSLSAPNRAIRLTPCPLATFEPKSIYDLPIRVEKRAIAFFDDASNPMLGHAAVLKYSLSSPPV
jgi:hypothetical protein